MTLIGCVLVAAVCLALQTRPIAAVCAMYRRVVPPLPPDDPWNDLDWLL